MRATFVALRCYQIQTHRSYRYCFRRRRLPARIDDYRRPQAENRKGLAINEKKSPSRFNLQTFTAESILRIVELKLCPKCRRPYLASQEFCPHCPPPRTWNQESWVNLGCLLVTIVPLFILILFWLLILFGFLFRVRI